MSLFCISPWVLHIIWEIVQQHLLLQEVHLSHFVPCAHVFTRFFKPEMAIKRERIQGQHTLQIVSFRYCCFFLSFLFVFLFIILSSYLIRYTYKKSIRYDLFLKKNYLHSSLKQRTTYLLLSLHNMIDQRHTPSRHCHILSCFHVVSYNL